MSEPHKRTYLMCEPKFFTVTYEINPWMKKSNPTDTAKAVRQWKNLVSAYQDLGHEVRFIDPLPECPDMVYTANGATVFNGNFYLSNFTYAERRPESAAFAHWAQASGFTLSEAKERNEGEGDILFAGPWILAGSSFRTSPKAHQELAALWHREIITLELVDPRFYHLDTALIVLEGTRGQASGDAKIAYYPPAFSASSREKLHTLFPDAICATDDDAEVLGLNAVSDGKHVVLNPKAKHLRAQIIERGYDTIGIDTSELLLGGGGIKCCTLELRA